MLLLLLAELATVDLQLLTTELNVLLLFQTVKLTLTLILAVLVAVDFLCSQLETNVKHHHHP